MLSSLDRSGRFDRATNKPAHGVRGDRRVGGAARQRGRRPTPARPGADQPGATRPAESLHAGDHAGPDDGAGPNAKPAASPGELAAADADPTCGEAGTGPAAG